MPHILIVEDEAAIADTLLYALQAEGFTTTWLSLAGEALQRLREEAFDLVVLDVGLPDISGFEACRQLRRFSEVPVIFLTARDAEIDRVVGLEIGADDYVVKPFSPRELAARVKALLRRAGGNGHALGPTASAAPLFHDDEAGQRISLRGQPLPLTRREYRLLAHLLRGAGRIHSREALLAAAWGDDSESTDRTVDTHIKTLRAKLREVDPGREYISTHRGMGYCLDI